MSDEATAKPPAPWDVPTIDGNKGKGYLTAGDLQELQKEAYNEAWNKGHADGYRAGEDAARERVERLEELLRALSAPLEQLDEAVEQELVDLALAATRQLFRREIRLEPTHVIGVVREAVQLLPVASRNVRLHLHPEDAALVREALSPTESEPAWTIVEDPLISRGGCSVNTDNSHIDATAESRLNAVINKIAGDERR